VAVSGNDLAGLEGGLLHLLQPDEHLLVGPAKS
jgi:hypothetical protein